MNSLAAVLFVGAICFGDVSGSYYHGPTAAPHVLHDGYLADTHEVAAAKSAHLATLSSQSHGHNDLSYTGHHGDSRYHGPISVPHVLHDGHIADTHEVAAAKAQHFAAVAKARAHHHDYSGQYAAGYDHYSGASGAYQGYGAHGQYPLNSEDTGAYHGYGTHGRYHGHYGDSRYHGPIAVPHVLHDGHIADTHEVVAAKAEHFAAVAKARAHHHHDYIGQYAAGYDHYSGVNGAYEGYGAHGGYHGPLANPVVLASGYLADTHEVAAIKHKHEIAHANQHRSYSTNSRGHYAH